MNRKEIDLHSEILEYLKVNRIIDETDSWGARGPDILIKGKGLIEVKIKDTPSQIKSAIQEIKARKQEKWNIKNLNFFSVLTNSSIWVYQKRDNQSYGAWNEPTQKWKYPEERPQFLSFLKNPTQKVLLDSFLPQILSDLYRQETINPIPVLMFLLNFQEPIHFSNGGFFFNQDTNRERYFQCDEITRNYIRNLSQKYQLRDHQKLKETLRHDFSHYQPDRKKSSFGKYYTPLHLVELVKKFTAPFLKKNPEAIVLDSAAGCGAFLEAHKEYHILGRDIDEVSCLILKELGYKNIAHENSLLYNQRAHYGISEETHLLIVGNPPYNDTTSKNKRYGTNQKEKETITINEAFKSSDYGISFLKHYASLSPDEIVVLHPLSYLSKLSHIRKLKDFFAKYQLVHGTIFSSAEFGESLKGHKTPFPIVCAHYKKGSMDKEKLLSFPFVIYESEINNIRTKSIILSGLQTIDDVPIRKYPPTKLMEKISDIELYHYNIRDSNSLKTSGNVSEKFSPDSIPIQFSHLWEYAYLNAYKRYAHFPYYLGNISPLYDKDLLDDSMIRDFLIMDFILHNQRFSSCKVNNEHSFLYKRFFINDMRKNLKTHPLYRIFISFCEQKISLEEAKQRFVEFFKEFFYRLIERAKI